MNQLEEMMEWTPEQFNAFATLHGLRELAGTEVKWWNEGTGIPDEPLESPFWMPRVPDFREQMIGQYLSIIRHGMSKNCEACDACVDHKMTQILVRSSPIDIPTDDDDPHFVGDWSIPESVSN